MDDFSRHFTYLISRDTAIQAAGLSHACADFYIFMRGAYGNMPTMFFRRRLRRHTPPGEDEIGDAAAAAERGVAAPIYARRPRLTPRRWRVADYTMTPGLIFR